VRRALRWSPFAAMIVLIPAAVTAATAAAAADTPAGATGGHTISASASGTGSPTMTNLAQLAATEGAAGAPRPANDAPAPRAVPGRPGLSRPATTSPTVASALATTVVANFDGNQQNGGFGWADATAAVSPTEIAETTNTFLQVYSKTGAIQCNGGVTLNRFLRTTDALASPRIIYDNGRGKFIMVVEVQPTTAAVPALYLSISDSSEACGTWFSYRFTFHGDQFPNGTQLDFPMLGMDTDALLISTVNLQPGGGVNHTVFAVLKSQVYAHQVVDFPVFDVGGVAAPAIIANASSASTFPFSYFINAVPGVGYRLYEMRNAGTLTVTFRLRATIPASFQAPTRGINEPGAPSAINASDGRIQAAPYTDGSGIWFAHGVDFAGFPTVEYGRIDIATNTVATAFAYHSNSSDDFNPSVAINTNPAGGTYLYLNWAFTDTPNGVKVSNVVDSDLLPAGRPALSSRVGTGAVTVTSTSLGFATFGQYSSVGVDPQASSGSCAVTAQQYLATTGWRTRLVRVGTC
jgi:hypothetical protein